MIVVISITMKSRTYSKSDTTQSSATLYEVAQLVPAYFLIDH